MNTVLKTILVLTVILLVATALLSITNNYTQPVIQEQKKQFFYNQINILFPDMKYTDRVPVYRQGQLAGEYYNVYNTYDRLDGYAIIQSVPGYQSDIKILAGFDKNKKLISIVLLEQMETPGIGGKIDNEQFLRQFDGKKMDSLKFRKDGGEIDAVTGATISSTATLNAVRNSYSIISE